MSKTLVIYFSAQGHTKKIAEQIAGNLSADLFEIIPKPKYTEEDLDWTNDNSRASREYADQSLRDIELASTDIPGWSDYDTVIIGYPIWWGIAAWATNSFIKTLDFGDKTVIPFCVSHSSDLGDSAKLLQADSSGGNWLPGHRFYQDATTSDIKSWTDNL
ncbi:MAG: flavodoxin [Candidatus Saccharibacteria bacterium]|nr:flavodoxin [Candidatus Saccharibacteria bacterium]